jgi:DNA topoisomerase-1
MAASNLFIIEAPGKRRSMFDALRRAGVRDIEIEATVGHLGSNPDGLKPLAVDSQYRETAYRIKPDKEHLALRIASKAADAKRIYLATDDDQEGDVIARDALLFCVPQEYRHKAVRMRLKALGHAEVVAALRDARPFDEIMAAQGDARRIIDRLVGSLSGEAGAVGRVQGSLLLALAEQRPVIGVVTHTLAAADGKGDFVAKVPVFAGQPVPQAWALDQEVLIESTAKAAMAQAPWNHDQIILASSLRTGATLEAVQRAMQTLYENGRMSYPRAKDTAITPESAKRLGMVARANGAMFRQELFGAIRTVTGVHTHEAPNPTALDVPVNRSFGMMSLEEQVLVTLTQNLIDCGIEARYDRPQVAAVPLELRDLNWGRLTAIGTRLWAGPTERAGFQPWTREQSLLHFMAKNELGRPSTIITHIDKFLTRGLTTQTFDLTGKGREWAVNTAAVLGDRNISKMIEEFIENNRKAPSQMVSDMVELLDLRSVKTAVEQQMELANHDQDEISAGYVP